MQAADSEDLLTENDGPAFGDPRAVVLRWEVPHQYDGMRADQYLVAKIGRISRTRAQSIIAKGDFRAHDGPLKPSARVRANLPVELWRIPPDSPDDFTMSPTVLYEDDDLVVVDKPGDLAVHPSARYLHTTLTHWLKQRADDTGMPIAHPCHRLDRETSGVLVCARSKRVEAQVKSAFQSSSVSKVYLAVVRGVLDGPRDIETPLALQGHRGLVRIKMVHDPAGLPSRTLVKPLGVDEQAQRSLVACFPKTGRQHQIRAHLAHAGHPIVGDKLYAMGEAYFDAFTRGEVDDGPQPEHGRHALHAYRLSFPAGAITRTFVAPFPDELAALVPGLNLKSCLRDVDD